jgi:hypothetical protein
VEKSWSEEDKGKYKEFCKDIETAKQLVKEMRNIIGGHVKHTVVARALQELTSASIGFLEYPHDPSERPAHTHYRFLNLILLAMIQAGDREHRSNDEIMKIPGVMARLMNAVALIDNIWNCISLREVCLTKEG